MYLKIMSGTVNLGDADCAKPYRIVECKEVSFCPGPPGSEQRGALAFADGVECPLEGGNAYILNDRGKTIDSFWSSYWSPAKQVVGSGQPIPAPTVG